MNLGEMLGNNNPLNKWKDLLGTVAKEVKKTDPETSNNSAETQSESTNTASDLGNLYKEISAKLGPLMGIDASQLEQGLNGKDPALLQKFTTLRDSYPKDSELRKVVNDVVVARRTSNTPGASLMELIGENTAKAVGAGAMVLGLQKTVDELSKTATSTGGSAYTNQSGHNDEDEHMHEGDIEGEGDGEEEYKNFVVKNEPLPIKAVSPVGDDPLIMTSPEGFRKQFGRHHKGLDIKRVYKTLYSTISGVVKEVNLHSKGYGNKLVIEDPKTGICQLMGHMKSIDVKVGDTITAGQEVGISGNEGSDAHGSKIPPHLHLEYYKMGENGEKIYYDPAYTLCLLGRPEFIDSMKNFGERTDEIIAFANRQNNSNVA